ncbi:hypothetical protein Sme01_03030 [Sphaerisporangium melleum]|uniref:Uncharacterized protein n=1 Tax=Sphaerisporangium melleum TaxID=321316 RepID=A0A917QNN0_9ACTN|nr:hypothetical protein [Sphaerisporangium melleum]GGK61336.1 hypothetical protein GCM10007964_00570 [Sphaerisporangium melleum]GII67827.1 hypothetical protein Sme01_03030 [Sphaerisporangium melleum]
MTRTPAAEDPEDWTAGIARDLPAVRAHVEGIARRLRELGVLPPDQPQPRPPSEPPVLIVLRPGDKVLVALVEDPGEAEAKDLANTLQASFPGVSFTVAGGVAGICVQS